MSGVVPSEGAGREVSEVVITIRQNNKQKTGLAVRSAVLLDDEPKVIGAHADYRREDYMFQRTQSLAMRELEWDHRLKPMRPWTPNFVANLILA
jgi:hypothetical protein